MFNGEYSFLISFLSSKFKVILVLLRLCKLEQNLIFLQENILVCYETVFYLWNTFVGLKVRFDKVFSFYSCRWIVLLFVGGKNS